MTILIISIVVAWILFSTLLVTIICINSSRLSHMDDPFNSHMGGKEGDDDP